VVDLWGGYAMSAGTRPWEKTDCQVVYSTTKTMTALTALLGWPTAGGTGFCICACLPNTGREFAASGKAGRFEGQSSDEPLRAGPVRLA